MRKLIGLSRPACLVLGALMHFYQRDAARDLLAEYVSALAPRLVWMYGVMVSVPARSR